MPPKKPEKKSPKAAGAKPSNSNASPTPPNATQPVVLNIRADSPTMRSDFKDADALVHASGPGPRERPVLVLVYSDSCFHCHAIQPTWNRVSNALGGQGVPVVSIEASALYEAPGNCKIAKNIVSHPDFRGVPYIILITGKSSNASTHVYNGDRSPADMMDFFNSHTVNAATRR